MGFTKQMQIEEAYLNSETEERLNESIAKDDDVGFKETDFVNLELIDVIENIQKGIKPNGKN